ncbi:MAG: radical SAM protein [Deltaproteobacteria bacterium]|nr:radical SAM protein [Deltaproteobacteria bacterium]
MICLVNPFITSVERYGSQIDDIGGHQMPLGIYYLGAQLIEKGFQVEVVDAEATHIRHEDIIHFLMEKQIKILGITSTTVAFRNARSLAEMARKQIPELQIVIGGPHMTAMPEKTMITRAFDFGILKEGEIALSKLVEFVLCKKGTISEIPNLYYYEKDQLIQNNEINPIKNMDSIPFPARQLSKDISIYKPPVGAYRKNPVVSMITSRGCPYQCIFCDNNTFGRKTRFFSAEYVVEEIKDVIKNYGAKEIAFLDDTFVIDKKRLYKIFELLNNENIKFPWTCMTRVNNVDYEILKFMKDNGCWQIRFGIESGNQEVLDFIKKGITLKQVRDVTKWCRELKMVTTGFFMIGHHIDTKDTIDDTIKFALSLPLTDITATINTPIPGTESYNKARNYGTYDEKDWTSLNYWTPIFVPKELSREYMLEKQSEIYRRFYIRPQIIYRQLLKIRSLKTLLSLVKSAMLGLSFVKNK